MGQFKPMVKMMTTEPSVELKLKKGGTVKKPAKMMDGGVMGGLAAAPSAVGARGGMSPVARPARPSMAARRAAMKGAPMGRPMMKEGGESKAEHAKEMKVAAEFKKHKGMPASKAHKGLNTGGVVMGQGGFKEGGAVPKSGILPVSESERDAKGYVKTKMTTAEGEHHTPKKTGEVSMGKPGGYKHGGKTMKYAKGGGVEGNVSTSQPGVTNTTTGEVKKGNAGGYKKGGMPMKDGKPAFLSKKKGGATKKAYATGGSVNDAGRPVAYPKKAVSAPIKNNLQSGTFKKGGDVKMAEGGISDFERKMFEEVRKKAIGHGASSNYEREVYLNALKKAGDQGSISDFERRKALKELIDDIEKPVRRYPGAGSVTETEKSVTVTPGKKRGGKVKC